MKNKKAIEMHFIILLVIGVIVFFVLAIMMPNLLNKEKERTEGFLDDIDEDGIPNSLDKCICTKQKGGKDGCPPDPTEVELSKTEEDC